MNWMIIGASALAFLALLFLFVGWRTGTLTDTQKRTRDQLRRLSMVGQEALADRDIVRDRRLSTINFVDKMLSGTTLARDLELLLYQAGVDMRVGTFLLICLISGVATMVMAASTPVAASAGVAATRAAPSTASARARERFHTVTS